MPRRRRLKGREVPYPPGSRSRGPPRAPPSSARRAGRRATPAPRRVSSRPFAAPGRSFRRGGDTRRRTSSPGSSSPASCRLSAHSWWASQARRRCTRPRPDPAPLRAARGGRHVRIRSRGHPARRLFGNQSAASRASAASVRPTTGANLKPWPEHAEPTTTRPCRSRTNPSSAVFV